MVDLCAHFERQASLVSGEPVSVEFRLLLLLARGTVDASLRETFRQLLRNPVNWDLVLFGAHMNMVGPLVCSNLEMLGSELSSETKLRFRDVRQSHTLRLLQLRAQEENLRRNYLEKAGVRFAFIKGRHLGSVLYGSDFARHYRDIDVLMDSKAIPGVVDSLLRNGYSITNSDYQSGRVSSVQALSRYYSAVELVGPDQIPIELHTRLDNSGCVFRAQLLRGNGAARLDDATHICYMFYHHARHKWSMLHWCADLAEAARLIAESPAEIELAAKRHGLVATMQESVKLKQDLECVVTSGTYPEQPASRFFIDAWKGVCFSTSAQSEQLKRLFGDTEREPDFHHKWQRTTGYSIRAEISRIRPTINDYFFAPAFENFPWIYWFIKPISVATRKISSIARVWKRRD